MDTWDQIVVSQRHKSGQSVWACVCIHVHAPTSVCVCVLYSGSALHSVPWVARNCSLLGLIGFFKDLQLIMRPLSALPALAGSVLSPASVDDSVTGLCLSADIPSFVRLNSNYLLNGFMVSF